MSRLWVSQIIRAGCDRVLGISAQDFAIIYLVSERRNDYVSIYHPPTNEIPDGIPSPAKLALTQTPKPYSCLRHVRTEWWGFPKSPEDVSHRPTESFGHYSVTSGCC